MKLKYFLPFTFLIFLFWITGGEELHASELTDQPNFDNSTSIVDKEVNTTLSTSIRHSYTLEVPVDGYLPEKSWTTYKGYSGYVYRDRYELTKNNTWKGVYIGILYKNVAPAKVEDER